MKKNQKIIILIIVILIIFIVSIVLLIKKLNKPTIGKNPAPSQVEIEEPREYGKLGLSGVGVFFDYYIGEFWASDIGTFLDDIYTNYIPLLYNQLKNADDDRIRNYYDSNDIDIRRLLGHANEEEFMTFIKDLQASGIDFNDWKSVHVLEDTFVNISDREGYAYCEYTFSTINDESLNFSLYVSHEKSKVPNFIITVIK